MKRKKLADCCGDLISCHVAQIGSSLILILVVLGRVIYVKGRVRSDQKLDRRPTLTTADPWPTIVSTSMLWNKQDIGSHTGFRNTLLRNARGTWMTSSI